VIREDQTGMSICIRSTRSLVLVNHLLYQSCMYN
jgi:hypothetical protein